MAIENPGLRRIWLYDGEAYRALREEGEGRSRNDWVCHEVWTHDGGFVVYHGTRKDGPFVGRINPFSGECIEIPLDPSFSSYGHFTVDGNGDLICDGYYHGKGEDDGGKGRYISLVHPDWEGSFYGHHLRIMAATGHLKMPTLILLLTMAAGTYILHRGWMAILESTASPIDCTFVVSIINLRLL